MNYSTKYPISIHLQPDGMVIDMQNWGVHVMQVVPFIELQNAIRPDQHLEKLLRQMAIVLEAEMSKQHPKGPS